MIHDTQYLDPWPRKRMTAARGHKRRMDDPFLRHGIRQVLRVQ